ncbi:MAG: dienelactone hydrolase family protein [Alphaproteobacteria bacterium]|nr:dienelactone hydrolase family protein [Alphaproteobacteria bacterium]
MRILALTVATLLACWPALAAETVRFASGTYDNLAKIVAKQPSAAIEATGTLSLPEGEGPVPAVVILHTIGGLDPQNEPWFAERLTQAGFATLVIDTYTPRGWTMEMATKGGAQGSASQTADAFAALKMLAARPRIDAGKIAVIGFSMGGDSAHFTAFEVLRKAQIDTDLRFAAHVPFYPAFAWGVPARPGAYSGAPILFLLGELEDAGPVAKVMPYLDWHLAADPGLPLRHIIYPGAYHAWTVPRFQPARFLAHHASVKACALLLVDNPPKSWRPETGAEVANFEQWRQCLTNKGYHMGFDSTVRDRSLADSIAFLRKGMDGR